MTPIYLYVLLGSMVVPIMYTIFRKDFIEKWKNFFISTSLIALIFLTWDALFTNYGIWGFNVNYCLGIFFLNMPLEEWLFFFVIPFCSLFAHFALFKTYPSLALKKNTTLFLTIVLIVLSVILILTNWQRAYTTVNFIFLALFLILGSYFHFHLLRQFYISFLIILIPFFIVNGILTGVVTENPIVWYNDFHNLGIRISTVPVEDIGYAFSMLFGNLLILETLNNRSKRIK